MATPARVERLALPKDPSPSGPPSAVTASGPPSPGSDAYSGHARSPHLDDDEQSQSSHEHVRAWREGSALPSGAPPSRPPSRAPSVRSGREPSNGPPEHKAVPAHKAESVGGFTLTSLIGGGPKLNRRASQSSRKSDSDRGDRSTYGATGPVGLSTDSVASLTKKYGYCEKVAIGKGATSVVRLAHKWERGSEEKLYAVKEFRKRRKNETEKEYVKKLTAEFCISSTLHHINVVETVDLVQDEQHHWCEVMEYCAGGDLYAAIKKGGMSREEVECCFGQILRGVKYLHSQGVAHRDIKPENLYFNMKGHVKIGDYGASTVYRLPWEATIHMSTGLCGSEPYIAPEQFLQKPYDARLVDIWACAIVFYCLHFQELPWRVAQLTDPLYAAYHAACLGSQSSNPSSLPPTISLLSPRACRPLLRKMLEPDPKNRCLVDDIIKDPWFQSIEVCTEPWHEGSKGHKHTLPGIVP
ncbi:Pkinase-domain-containing protein [Calocera viscosa TUFC12733]|uniref:non-specific serine/threonine protein kinase n=1 Tax=Calocera viscosa (strain TUFC12733) TaxID=1330018 RepID=A0A167R8Y8_CALVF|nr:Pkinase-domain-containing protein [Calocera viscosa TUFC12733]